MWVIKLSLGAFGTYYFREPGEWSDTLKKAKQFGSCGLAVGQVKALEAEEVSNVTVELAP
jgi:hypothetical protein